MLRLRNDAKEQTFCIDNTAELKMKSNFAFSFIVEYLCLSHFWQNLTGKQNHYFLI